MSWSPARCRYCGPRPAIALLLCAALTVLLVGPRTAAAKGLRTMLIVDLAARKVDPDDAATLTDKVREAIGGTGWVTLISDEAVRKILEQEKERQLGDPCDTTSCFVEVGGALGARYVVAGNVSRLGTTHVLTLVLHDIGTETELLRITRESESMSGLARLVGPAALDLLAPLRPDVPSEEGEAPRSTTGDVHLQLTPSAARYRFDGGRWAPFAAGRLNLVPLEPGDHRLEVRAGGYQQAERVVAVRRGAVVSVRLGLVPVVPGGAGKGSGYLQVESEPVGAEVRIDGALQERPAPWVYKLGAGEHFVQVSRPRYQRFESRVRIKAGETASLPARLVSDFGPLEIISVPAGARVWIDGVRQEKRLSCPFRG